MMEHDSSEQQKKQDGEKLSEYEDAANGSVPNVMATLGLGKTTRLSTQQVEEMIFDLDSPEWSTRVAALRKLGKLGTQAPITSIVDVLSDEHEAVRSAAVRALGNLGTRAPIEPLLTTLNDASWHVRAASVMALGKQRERVPGEPFIRALHDTDETVRAAAAWALGKQGERAPLAPLVAALQDSAWSVREAAVLALGERGGEGAVRPLLAARMDEDSAVRATAEATLQQTYPEIASDRSASGRKEPELPFQQSVEAGLNGHMISQPLNAATDMDNEEIEHLDSRQHNGKIFPLKRKAAFPNPGQKQQETQQKPRHPVLGIAARWLVAAALLIGIAAAWAGISRTLRPPTPGLSVSTGSLAFNTSAVNAIAWSHDGQYLASVGNSAGQVQIWTLANGKQQTPEVIPLLEANAHVLALNWSSTDLHVVVSVDGQIKLEQVDTTLNQSKILWSGLTLQGTPLVAWSSNGLTIATENKVQLCDFNGCRALTLNELAGHITALALSSDGATIATASDTSTSTDKNIQVWNTQGKLIAPFTDPTYRVSMASSIIAVAWSPQNDRLAYESSQEQLEVWDRASSSNTGNTTLNYPHASKPITTATLTWSPDGKRIASVENSKQVQVWDATSGSLLYTSLQQSGSLNNLAWSPDGQHLAVTSANGLLQIWSIS